jgi:hypothetical protein
MPSVEEKLTEQFYAWELRGRGWQLWDVPVAPEPPFRPFYGHYLPEEPMIDDGRRPTALSRFAESFRRKPEQAAVAAPVEMEGIEPEPDVLFRDNLIELQIALPADFQVSKVTAEQFLLNLAYCSEPVSFELIGSTDAIQVQLAVAEPDADSVQAQLEAHFPDAVVTQQRGVLEREWQRADAEGVIVDFGLSHEFMLPLATIRQLSVDPLIGITGALGQLAADEVAVFQVIFHPTRQPWAESVLCSVTDNEGGPFFVNAPELVSAAELKLASPLYAAVVRIAGKAGDTARAWEIARALAGALRVFADPNGNELIPLENDGYEFVDHEDDLLRRQSHRCGMILNSDELVSLVHLPSASVRVSKLRRQIQKTKAAPPIVLQPAGVMLGENHHAGKISPVRLNPEQRSRHTYIVGASGTGKSTLLYNLIQQDIESGQGLAVLDPHGDLIDKILGCIPDKRTDDVVLVDPSDEEYSVGFNILSAHSDLEKNLLASDLVSVFQRLSTSWGDQMGSVLHNAILAFLESSEGGTLADLRRFLIEPEFRNRFLQTVHDPEVTYYWHKGFPLLSGNKSIGPVLTRLETFLARKPIRAMVSQQENRLDFADIMNSGKIFLAKLAQGTIGKENSYLLGSLLVSKFHQSAMSRQSLPESQRRYFWLYIDEFHNFITPSTAEILSGARKYRIGLILAHQELRQLQRDSETASAVLSNPYTRICFRVGDQDAKSLEHGFSFFEAKDLQNLSTGQALCRIERSDWDFNLSVSLSAEIDDAQAAATRQRVIEASRKKYAVSRASVETELAKLRPVIAAPPPRREPAAVVAPPIAPPAPQPKPVVRAPPEPPAPLGRGGREHQYLQHLVQQLAIGFSFEVEIEKQLAEGKGSVDVALRKGGRSFACEISITTPIEYELGNLKKCFAAGFEEIVVLCTEPDKLAKIREAVAENLPDKERNRIRFCLPDELSATLLDLAAKCASKEVVVHGRKTNVMYRPLSEAEAKQRRETLAKVTAQSLKKLKPDASQ